MRKLSGLLLAAVMLMVLPLTACSTGKAPAPGEAPAASKAEAPASPAVLKKVSLVLDWYPNAVHTFVLAAQEKGFFKEEGLEVEIKMPAENPTDGIKLVGAGKETFALYYQPDVLLARAEQIPIQSVAAVVRRPLNGIMTPADSGVKSPKDLEGKVVGYPGIPLNLPLVKTMLKTAGGDPEKVTMQDISWDLIPAIATKKVPAIAGGFVNHEKLLLEKEGVKMTYFSPADWGVPNYYELVLITGEAMVKDDRVTVESFWRALSKGFGWVKEHQQDGLTMLMARQEQSFPLDRAIEAQSLQMLLPWMEEAGVSFGAQRAEDWEKVAQWMKEQGMLKDSVKPADAFVSIVK